MGILAFCLFAVVQATRQKGFREPACPEPFNTGAGVDHPDTAQGTRSAELGCNSDQQLWGTQELDCCAAVPDEGVFHTDSTARRCERKHLHDITHAASGQVAPFQCAFPQAATACVYCLCRVGDYYSQLPPVCHRSGPSVASRTLPATFRGRWPNSLSQFCISCSLKCDDVVLLIPLS